MIKELFTQLPNEIKKLGQKLNKKQLTYAQVDNLLVAIAHKFDALDKEDQETGATFSEIEVNIEPEIVLSETFSE